MKTPRTETAAIVAALRILARDIKSGDGVANAAIAEAADRLEQLHGENAALRETFAVQADRCRDLIEELERDNVALREAAPKIKAAVSEQLQAALSGLDLSLRYSSDPNYPDQFIRWGLVEKRIHKAVDAALRKEAQP